MEQPSLSRGGAGVVFCAAAKKRRNSGQKKYENGHDIAALRGGGRGEGNGQKIFRPRLPTLISFRRSRGRSEELKRHLRFLNLFFSEFLLNDED